MNRIGIITILKVNNYGAELQAYATQKALQNMGYDAEIIDYLFYKNPRHKRSKASKPLFPVSLKKRLAEYLYPRISKIKQLTQNSSCSKTREERFERFHKENTRMSVELQSAEELCKISNTYSTVVVGSDQVWNPGNYTSLDPYFLKFAGQGVKRVSYASSFGVHSLPANTFSYYKEALAQIDHISVREEDATRLVQEVAGRKAEWVLDPTLLLNHEEWTKISVPVMGCPSKFVLLYELTPCPYLKTLAMHIAQEKGACIVRITKDAVRMESDDDNIRNITDAGPAEFLWLFEHAKFVVTNSFHGTAFSINMNKDFFVVTPARKQNNSRQESILKLFGLQSRLVSEDTPWETIAEESIDYTLVNTRLDTERTKSINFLTDAIDG